MTKKKKKRKKKKNKKKNKQKKKKKKKNEEEKKTKPSSACESLVEASNESLGSMGFVASVVPTWTSSCWGGILSSFTAKESDMEQITKKKRT